MTTDEQVEAYKLDLLSDAAHAEEQAAAGPFYPERGITADSLRAYANDCRRRAEHPAQELLVALRGTHPFPEQSLGLRLAAQAELQRNPRELAQEP